MQKAKSSASALFENGRLLSSDFSIEAHRTGRGISLTVSGIVGISELTDTEVVLKSHRAKLSVTGKKLSLTVFEGRVVEIDGVIQNLEFSYGKK